jgi:hypothetical protein
LSDIDRMLQRMWDGPPPPWSPWRKPPGTSLSDLFGLSHPLCVAIRETAWQRAGHPAWVESVRVKLVRALAAAADGRGFDWNTGFPTASAADIAARNLRAAAYLEDDDDEV